MVFKILSPKNKYKDNNVYEDIVNYCMDPEKTNNGLIKGFNLDIDSAAEDMYALSKEFGKLKGTRIRHMVLSFDPEDEAHIYSGWAFLIATEVCKYYANDYQIFAAVHEGSNCVHAHLVMNTVNIHTGEKYKGRKKDYYDFQKHLRKVARKRGVTLRIITDNGGTD